jgi:uncharacterized membrane protein required for colicin V production
MIDELFSTANVVWSTFVAACFGGSFSDLFHQYITGSMPSGFLIAILFLLAFASGKYISNYILSLISKPPTGTKYMVASIFLAFIKYFLIFSLAIYILFNEIKVLKESNSNFKRGAIYKMLFDTGSSIVVNSQISRAFK